LFDTVAVYLGLSSDYLEMENLGIRVTDRGMTEIDDTANKVNCATKWKDMNAYEDFLVARLTGQMSAMEQSKPAAAAESEQTMCPVMGGAIDKTVFVEYKGKKVYFCCPICKAKFEADPEKYMAKLPQFQN
jgi:YHS domain-containing protein